MRLPRLILAAALAAGCGSTSPPAADVTGRWVGSTTVASEQWTVDMTLASPDSIHGRATLTSVPARVNNDMVVSGSVTGDTIRLLLRPIEDADIHLVAHISDRRLDGRLWMNAFTSDPHDITFVRQ